MPLPLAETGAPHYLRLMGTPVVALTFGSNSGIDDTRDLVAQGLGVAFEGRSSEYLGGDYYRGRYGAGDVLVRPNDDGDEPAEPDWPGPVVVQVEAAEDAATVESALTALTLLRRQPWTHGG